MRIDRIAEIEKSCDIVRCSRLIQTIYDWNNSAIEAEHGIHSNRTQTYGAQSTVHTQLSQTQILARIKQIVPPVADIGCADHAVEMSIHDIDPHLLLKCAVPIPDVTDLTWLGAPIGVGDGSIQDVAVTTDRMEGERPAQVERGGQRCDVAGNLFLILHICGRDTV